MFNREKEVEEMVKRLQIASVFAWFVVLGVLSIAAASYAWPWYIGMAAGFAWTFVALAFEGQLEDNILVSAYGPSKQAPRD